MLPVAADFGSILIATKTKKRTTAATKHHHSMVKKKRSTGRRRKKSNTTINADEQHTGAKRSNTAASVSVDVKNRLVSAIKAMIDSMDEEHLYSVMEYAGKVGKELMASEKQASANTSAAKATTTTTTTTEIAGAKTTITMTTGGASISEPRTPLETTQETTPFPIRELLHHGCDAGDVWCYY